MHPSEAAAQLDAMQQSRERLAALCNCPPERHLAFALILGGLVASGSLPTPWSLVAEGVLFLAIGAVALWDRKRTGMFVNGYRRGRTLPLTLTLLATTMLLLCLGIWLREERGMQLAPAACGVATAIIAFLASVQWQRVWVRELKAMP